MEPLALHKKRLHQEFSFEQNDIELQDEDLSEYFIV